MCAAIGKHGFIHGVGSFDPLPDGVLLWSRLTLPDEALGKPVDVNWAIFEDEACKELVQEYVESFVVDRQGCRCFGRWSFLTSCNYFDWAQGVVQTGPERDYTICADVRGLEQLTRC